MKYLIALVLGFLVGAAIFIVGMIYNPFVVDRGLSPLSVARSRTASGVRCSMIGSIVFSPDSVADLEPTAYARTASTAGSATSSRARAERAAATR